VSAEKRSGMRALFLASFAVLAAASGARAQTVEPAWVPEAWALAAGAGRDAETRAWIPQVGSAGRLPLLSRGRLTLDGVAEGAALLPLEDDPAGRALGSLRLTASGGSGAAWLGTGGGGASTDAGTRALLLAEAGARWRWRGAGVVLTVRQTHAGALPGTFRDSIIPGGGGGLDSIMPGGDTIGDRTVRVAVMPGVPSRRYTDAELGMEVVRGPLRLSATAGGRLADNRAGASWWARAGADVRLTARTSLSLAGGRVAGVPELGSTDAPFLRLAVRFTPPGRAPAVALPAGVAPSAEAPEAFTVHSAGALRTLDVRVSGATRVEMKGDFTGWQPVELAPGPEAGSWRATLRIAPGTYRLNLRVDGGEWRAPPGLLDVEDEFGGRVGLLVVS